MKMKKRTLCMRENVVGRAYTVYLGPYSERCQTEVTYLLWNPIYSPNVTSKIITTSSKL